MHATAPASWPPTPVVSPISNQVIISKSRMNLLFQVSAGTHPLQLVFSKDTQSLAQPVRSALLPGEVLVVVLIGNLRSTP